MALEIARQSIFFRHNDMAHLEEFINSEKTENKLIILSRFIQWMAILAMF